MRVLALRVQQPLGEFYLTTLPASFFVDRVRNRPRTSASTQSEDIQRIFSKSRVENIADFTTVPQATFPTPIILGVDSSTITEAQVNVDIDGAESAVILLDIPDDGNVGDVLDGQHRILGLRQSPVRSEFDLAVVLMFDLSLDDKAFVFSTITMDLVPATHVARTQPGVQALHPAARRYVHTADIQSASRVRVAMEAPGSQARGSARNTKSGPLPGGSAEPG